MKVEIFTTPEGYKDWLRWNDYEVISVIVFNDELVVTYKY